MRAKKNGTADEYEFRSVTGEDMKRERVVEEFIVEASRGLAGQGMGARHAHRARRQDR